MIFKKYIHIERFGVDEVLDIELGETYIFPKLDGTNSSVWLEDGIIKAGSRNRELTLDNDNAGFYDFVLKNDKIKKYLDKHPTHRLYGEWLVPHSLRTYRTDARNKFYIFDIEVDDKFLSYNLYKDLLDEFELDYITPLAVIKNASEDALLRIIDKNTFLIRDNSGVGEGIVIKNYDFYNKMGRQIWAKIVTNEFKDTHKKVMGAKVEYGTLIEEKIVLKYCTKDFIDKEYAKLVQAKGGWDKKYIFELFGRVFSEMIKEETWHIIKDFDYPKINFKTLNNLCIKQIKELKKDLFY